MHTNRQLSDEKIKFFHKHGYLVCHSGVPEHLLSRLEDELASWIEESRGYSRNYGETIDGKARFDLETGHCSKHPKLRRVANPADISQNFQEVLWNSPIVDMVAQLIGPSIRFHHCKLNIKLPGMETVVHYHQDHSYDPHTNDDMLAFGVMLDDVDESNGPLQIIPGSHKGPVLSHNGSNGVFCGAVDPLDPDFDQGSAVMLTGRAGSMTVHHARTLHGSAPNHSDRSRLILFYECCAADAWPLMGGSAYLQRLPQREQWEDLLDRVIIGQPVLEPRMAEVPVRLPLPPAPDVSSIFQLQKSGGARSAFAPMSG